MCFPLAIQNYSLFYQQKSEKEGVLTESAGGLSDMDPMDGGMRYTPGSSVRFIPLPHYPVIVTLQTHIYVPKSVLWLFLLT